VNTKRLAWILMAFSAGILILLWYTHGKQEIRRKALEEAARAAAAQAATRPATEPLASVAPAEEDSAEAPEPAPALEQPDESTDVTAVVEETPAPKGPTIVLLGAGQPEKHVIGSLDPRGDFMFELELNSLGAAIETLKLRDHYFTVEDKKLARDWPAYQEALAREPEKHPGSYALLNRVSSGGRTHLPLETRALSIQTGDAEGVRWSGPLPWRLESREVDKGNRTETIRFVCDFAQKDEQGNSEPVLRLIKSYTVRAADYTIDVSLRAENQSGEAVQLSLEQMGPTGAPREDLRVDMRKVAWGKLQTEGEQKVQTSKEDRQAKREKVHVDERHVLGSSSADEPVLWIGQTNKFFGSMMYLVPRFEGRLQAPEWEAQFFYDEALESETSAAQVPGVRIPAWSIKPGESQELQFELFAGPKRREMFVEEGADYFRPRYRELDYISTIDLRSCVCASDWLALQMIRLLRLLAIPTFGNYGLAIIVLVILVRLALHPLTKRGQVHMQGMKKLAPQMKELEKKYADDKEAMNRERMKIYKEQGAAPLLGCLPMLLQMPILIALWTGINASIDLRHAAFLPVWIVDLAAPDRLFSWSKELPLIGTSFNLLPILLAGAMYWQMKLNPQTSGAGATPEQQKQQKMMSLMMPLMMPVLFYQAASGLTLYFLVSTFFGAAEQQIIRKHIEAKEAEAAAIETTVQLPGKSPRGSRPRKPKGPNWFKHS
jgi:YidC/Oxa1 family membrane protein insertase